MTQNHLNLFERAHQIFDALIIVKENIKFPRVKMDAVIGCILAGINANKSGPRRCS